MSEYREAHPKCPGCPEGHLEAQIGAATVGDARRLACGQCNGLWLPFDDLSRTMDDVVGWSADAEIVGEAPGARACPQCVATMTTFRLRTAPMKQMFRKSEVQLDRCEHHGVWLDGGELQAVISESTEALGKLHTETDMTRPIRWLYARLRGHTKG